MKSIARLFAVIVCISLMLPKVADSETRQPSDQGFAVRLIDETADQAHQCPAGDDRLPNSTVGIGQPGTQCLKRSSGFSGQLVEAHVGTGADGQAVALLTLTHRGADQLAALTRDNTGRQMAWCWTER
jgi:preprotein translocase subunit SecD